MFKENFIRLCAEKKESPSSVCKKIGISSAAFSQWTENTIPRKSTLLNISDYFGVSVNYLLGENPTVYTELSFSEQRMLELFRSVPVDDQKRLVALIEAYLKTQL